MNKQDDLLDDVKTLTVSESRTLPQRPPSNSFQPLESSPRFKSDNELLKYQLDGLNWLIFCWFNKRNSILADQTGKTVQAVSMIEYLHSVQHNRGPFLVVAPQSKMDHWKRVFEEWTDMNVVIYQKNRSSRELGDKHEFHEYHDQMDTVAPDLYKFHVLITSYETVIVEASKLGEIKWQYMIIDEAHRLKNKESKLVEALGSFNTDHKLLLTATPLQNNIEEFWALLNFMDPESFSSCADLVQIQSTGDLAKFYQQISPYMLRRLREDVEN